MKKERKKNTSNVCIHTKNSNASKGHRKKLATSLFCASIDNDQKIKVPTKN